MEKKILLYFRWPSRGGDQWTTPTTTSFSRGWPMRKSSPSFRLHVYRLHARSDPFNVHMRDREADAILRLSVLLCSSSSSVSLRFFQPSADVFLLQLYWSCIIRVGRCSPFGIFISISYCFRDFFKILRFGRIETKE